jgi:hypothetical protein
MKNEQQRIVAHFQKHLEDIVRAANSSGVVLSIENHPIHPPAMGRTIMVPLARPARGHY